MLSSTFLILNAIPNVDDEQNCSGTRIEFFRTAGGLCGEQSVQTLCVALFVAMDRAPHLGTRWQANRRSVF